MFNLFQDNIEESQENGENDDDLQLLIRREISRSNIVVGVIEEIITMKKEDTFPGRLLEAANTILKTSLGINVLKNHKDKFVPLLGDASALVVVFWQIYKKSDSNVRSNWPHPYLENLIEELVDTVYRVHKLMTRKREKKFGKRIYFGIRDLTKFKKYQQKLDSVASGLKGKPNNININEVLLEVVNSLAQFRVEDIEPSEEAAESNCPISRRKNAAQLKTRKRSSQVFEDQENKHIPVDHPAAAKGSSSSKKLLTTPKQKVTQRSNSSESHLTPLSPQYQSSISGISFNNPGSGIMINENVGNTHNSTISGVDNTNPMDHFQPRRRLWTQHDAR